MTNECVNIVNQLRDALSVHGIHPENVLFVEHYESNAGTVTETSVIEFNFRDGKAAGAPAWRHIDRATLEAYLTVEAEPLVAG